MSIRPPYVAGTFYSSNPKILRRDIEQAFLHKYGPGKLPEKGRDNRSIIALICPHAGYMYSSHVAAHSYYELSKEKAPESVVILNPNHTGMGTMLSMYGKGAWRTPFGTIQIDEKLAFELYNHSNLINFDDQAHIYEHSAEVQLPFLQYLYDNKVKIVPITMGYQDLETSRNLGDTLGNVLKDKNAIIIASTDLTHQESQKSAIQKDELIIEAIKAMSEIQLQKIIQEYRLTMCGYGPVSAALIAAKMLGANKAEVLSYHTSGDITGDFNAVVGYASAKVIRTV